MNFVHPSFGIQAQWQSTWSSENNVQHEAHSQVVCFLFQSENVAKWAGYKYARDGFIPENVSSIVSVSAVQLGRRPFTSCSLHYQIHNYQQQILFSCEFHSHTISSGLHGGRYFTLVGSLLLQSTPFAEGIAVQTIQPCVHKYMWKCTKCRGSGACSSRKNFLTL